MARLSTDDLLNVTQAERRRIEAKYGPPRVTGSALRPRVNEAFATRGGRVIGPVLSTEQDTGGPIPSFTQAPSAAGSREAGAMQAAREAQSRAALPGKVAQGQAFLQSQGIGAIRPSLASRVGPANPLSAKQQALVDAEQRRSGRTVSAAKAQRIGAGLGSVAERNKEAARGAAFGAKQERVAQRKAAVAERTAVREDVAEKDRLDRELARDIARQKSVTEIAKAQAAAAAMGQALPAKLKAQADKLADALDKDILNARDEILRLESDIEAGEAGSKVQERIQLRKDRLQALEATRAQLGGEGAGDESTGIAVTPDSAFARYDDDGSGALQGAELDKASDFASKILATFAASGKEETALSAKDREQLRLAREIDKALGAKARKTAQGIVG